MYWQEGNRVAELQFCPSIDKWNLLIKFEPRITESMFDVGILWSPRLTPTEEEAKLKAKQILEQEWR